MGARVLLLLSVVAIIAWGLVACGGGDAASNDEAIVAAVKATIAAQNTVEPEPTIELTTKPTAEPTIEPTTEPTTEPTPTITPTHISVSNSQVEAEQTKVNQVAVVEVIISANLRSGPGTDFPVVGTAFAGDIYPYVGSTNNGWVQLDELGEVWIGLSLVEIKNNGNELPDAMEADPTIELTAKPTIELTAKPTIELTAKPTIELTAKPTIEPTAKPTIEPTAKPTIESTVEPTIEPTPESTPVKEVILPITIDNGEGVQFTVNQIDLLQTIEAASKRHRPEGDVFAVLIGEITNSSDSAACIMGKDFTMISDSNHYDMYRSLLNAAKEIYDLDYPGFFWGQCLGYDEQEPSFLVFDVKQDEDLLLEFGKDNVEIGRIINQSGDYAIVKIEPTTSADVSSAPIGTLTSTPTLTATSTKTPTVVPEALAVVRTNANLRSGPGSNFDVIDSASAGDELEVFGRNDDGTWVKVGRDDHHWIWVNLIELSVDIDEIAIPPTPTPTQTPTVTPSPNATATNQALSQSSTSTAEAQRVIDATATIEAYASSPPVGKWCDSNSTRSVCVGNFEYRRSVGYSSASANSRFIVFSIRVDNRSSGNIYINPHDVSLVLETGATYSHDTATYYFTDYFDAVTIASGDNSQGTIVFLVKKDIAPEKVIYRGGGFFESDVIINLKDEPVED